MGQGRGSALSSVVLLLCLVIQSKAAVYTVGDAAGWSLHAEGWPNGKKFKAGDQLLFKYDPNLHNVAVVDVEGYIFCGSTGASTIYTSGHDRVTLRGGTSYFICAVPDHCDAGMRIAVTAA